MDQQALDRHNRQNTIHTIALLTGLAIILGVVGMLVWGPVGLFYAVAIGAATLFIGRRYAPQMVLRMYRAEPITRESSPQLYEIVEELARRAELDRVPGLYYIPSPVMNAFTTGFKDNAIICVFDGLLKKLTLDEISGVLAHEISHVKNNDTLVLGMADTVSRITGFMPLLAIMMLLGNMSGMAGIPWLTIGVMFFAPQLTAALQTMLSHSREFDADIDAAALTRDPGALASALGKIQQHHVKKLERVMLPGRKESAPSHTRSHPNTQERIERLLALEAPPYDPDTMIAFANSVPRDQPAFGVFTNPPKKTVAEQPRWRLTGLWH